MNRMKGKDAILDEFLGGVENDLVSYQRPGFFSTHRLKVRFYITYSSLPSFLAIVESIFTL